MRSGAPERSSLFSKPLSLSKKFMALQGKSKLDDGFKNHPFLQSTEEIFTDDKEEKAKKKHEETN